MESQGPHFAWPRGKVFIIGMLCFITFMVEGSVLDWGALYLKTSRGLPPSQAGLSYTAFAVTMTVGRLWGDRVVDALGGKKILVGGGLCAATGLALVIVVPFALASLLGFALVGIGASNVVPVLFTQAGRQKTMPAGVAIAVITTIGYVGMLLGPAAIGFIAHASSLTLALGLVALSLLTVPLAAKTVMSQD
jgi:MFS family permease